MRAPYLDDGDVRLYLGDCVEVMAEMDAESVDAVVCDPPYGLEFMGREWDRHDDFQEWCQWWAAEALCVLKPGGHLLAFGGTRTFHRLTCGIEDAGFEIRDCLSWLYGSGFPKSLDVGKALDRAAGAEREVTGVRWTRTANAKYGNGKGTNTETLDSAPVTDLARQWQGWGTALKPAWEPCVVARKPLVGTVARNVTEHGTGALNVDGCRIKTADDLNGGAYSSGGRAAVMPGDQRTGAALGMYEQGRKAGGDYVQPLGRWPANVCLDEQAAGMLDAQSGESRSTVGKPREGRNGCGWGMTATGAEYGDSGGASRFFYTAKASRADRNTSGADNTHPTVKPTDLMRWLVRLVTPPGGVVLDPFAGSGSTLVAARAEGFRAIGIEREAEYVEIIVRRLSQLSLFA